MWQLVFASCHRLKSKKKKKKKKKKKRKRVLMVMADPSDLGHGKKGQKAELQEAGSGNRASGG